MTTANGIQPVTLWIKDLAGRRHRGYFGCKLINPYLTEEAYIQYDLNENKPLNDDIDEREEIKEEKSEYPHDGSLEMQHLNDAECFMIIYDMMDSDSLQKTKKYIDRIFKVRGYDQRLSEIKRDQMCSFPVSLVGLNWTLSRQWQRTLNQASNIAKDDVSESIQSKERISTNSAARFAMEQCVDFMTMDIFKSPDLGNWEMTLQMRRDLIGLVKHSLDYYYYIALSDQRRENLRRTNIETTSCDIL